jgi:hypothetical protein
MASRISALDDAISATGATASRAGAAALRKTHALVHSAPMGRAFTSIATLCELTERVENHLAAGHAAMAEGAEPMAVMEFTRARALAGGTIIEARPDPALREPAPKYLIKRR